MHASPDPDPEPDADLRADCSRCAALCCVALPLWRSADFAIDKPAGVPCPNLTDELRCGVHADLTSLGFRGCVAYDCFGAGQRVTTVTLPGVDWRTDAAAAALVFITFAAQRALHELRWLVAEATIEMEALPDGPDSGSDAGLGPELADLATHLDRLIASSAAELGSLDVDAERASANGTLTRCSEAARRLGPWGLGEELRGADLSGRNLRRRDLRGALLRGASLLGADLRGADLRGADLTGADLRGADLTGADLTGALFVSRLQLASARGNATTVLPTRHVAPTHWG